MDFQFLLRDFRVPENRSLSHPIGIDLNTAASVLRLSLSYCRVLCKSATRMPLDVFYDAVCRKKSTHTNLLEFLVENLPLPWPEIPPALEFLTDYATCLNDTAIARTLAFGSLLERLIACESRHLDVILKGLYGTNANIHPSMFRVVYKTPTTLDEFLRQPRPRDRFEYLNILPFTDFTLGNFNKRRKQVQEKYPNEFFNHKMCTKFALLEILRLGCGNNKEKYSQTQNALEMLAAHMPPDLDACINVSDVVKLAEDCRQYATLARYKPTNQIILQALHQYDL